MVLLIDNFDSFTWNLVHYLQELGAHVHVMRNNEVSQSTVAKLSPSHVVVSPGPGRPEQTGRVREVLATSKSTPVLGVCLGHQLLAQVTGAKVSCAQSVMHGKVSTIVHDNKGVFVGLPQRIEVCRYHSLSVERATLGPDWHVSAESVDDGEVMAIRHKTLPWCGMQFHPEAILTQSGHAMLENFLRL